MQHTLIYMLVIALSGLHPTSPQQRFHCRMTGKRDLVRCCCERRDAEAAACDSKTGGCATSGKTICCKSKTPCDRKTRDEDTSVAASNCCIITNIVANTPTVVDGPRRSRDIDDAVHGQPIVIPAVRNDQLYSGHAPPTFVMLNRNGSPGMMPRFILHCSYLI